MYNTYTSKMGTLRKINTHTRYPIGLELTVYVRFYQGYVPCMHAS